MSFLILELALFSVMARLALWLTRQCTVFLNQLPESNFTGFELQQILIFKLAQLHLDFALQINKLIIWCHHIILNSSKGKVSKNFMPPKATSYVKKSHR